MIKTIGNSTLLAVLILAGVGCSTTPLPKSEMARSESALQDAELAGAREFAPLEFRRANEKYAEANAAVEDNDYVLARLKADESRIDAELAEAKSFAEKSSIDMQKLRSKIQRLRSQAPLHKDG